MKKEEKMKKQLLIIVALLATTGLYAMQAPRSFSYSQYKFTIPANILNGMKEGEKFVITGVPATTMSELYVKDAQGNPFAKNTYSEYPGGKAGTLTYTVLSTAERQKFAKPASAPVKAQVMPSAAATVKKAEVKPLPTLRPAPATATKADKIAELRAAQQRAAQEKAAQAGASKPELLPTETKTTTSNQLTKEQVLNTIQDLIAAIKNNDIAKLKTSYQKMRSQADISDDNIKKSIAESGIIDTLQAEMLKAKPAAMLAVVKLDFQTENPSLTEQQIAQKILTNIAKEKDQIKALPLLKWAIEQEKMKDTTGAALENAIDNKWYEAAVLLEKSGALVTPFARELAEKVAQSANNPDERYLVLFGLKQPTKTQTTTTATVSTEKVLTNEQIIDELRKLEAAIKNNDTNAINSIFQKLPKGEAKQDLQDLIKLSGVYDALDQALHIYASPETKIAFYKAWARLTFPSISEAEIAGKALEAVIENGFLQATRLLIQSGAPISAKARALAQENTKKFKDDAYELELKNK